MKASDLRAGAALVIAGLIAEGDYRGDRVLNTLIVDTVILLKNLNGLGATIWRES